MMLSSLKRLCAVLEDELVLRVTICATGVLLLLPTLLALFTGLAFEVNDGALYIVLAVFAAIGGFLVYAAVLGNSAVLKKAVVWAVPDSLFMALALLTMAIPIALVIKRFRQNHGQSAL